MQQPRVSVVIPALNEAENLPLVLPRIPDDVHEIILVDGESVDRTIDVARSLIPHVRIVRQESRGKGAALRSGFAAATGDIVVMLDADGSTDPGEIPRFVHALLGGADFAKGSRFLHAGGTADMPFHRRLGNQFFVVLVRILFGGRYSDLCYGYNAFWRRCLPLLALDGDGFEIETMMNLRALKSGLRIHEVPSFEARRVYGNSNLRAIPDGIRVIRTIFREWRSSPLEAPILSGVKAPASLVPVPVGMDDGQMPARRVAEEQGAYLAPRESRTRTAANEVDRPAEQLGASVIEGLRSLSDAATGEASEGAVAGPPVIAGAANGAAPASGGHLSGLAALLTKIDPRAVDRVVALLESASDTGATVFVAGGDRSSAIAAQWVAGLGRPLAESGHPRLRVHPLAEETPRQVELLARPGDLLVVIDSDGDSASLIDAMRAARDASVKVIALVGADDVGARDLADEFIFVQHEATIPVLVESAHLVIANMIAGRLALNGAGHDPSMSAATGARAGAR